MGEQESNQNTAEVVSNQYYTSANALQIRLNVEPLLAQLEMDIRGLKETWNEEKQSVMLTRVSEPLFKQEIGIQTYMSHVRSVVNSQVVQGNLDEDTYADYMEYIHSKLAQDLMINRYKYGLEKYHYHTVISLAMNTVRGFLTRTIGDKERQSYSHTMKHVENSQTVQGRTGGIFNFRN